MASYMPGAGASPGNPLFLPLYVRYVGNVGRSAGQSLSPETLRLPPLAPASCIPYTSYMIIMGDDRQDDQGNDEATIRKKISQTMKMIFDPEGRVDDLKWLVVAFLTANCGIMNGRRYCGGR